MKGGIISGMYFVLKFWCKRCGGQLGAWSEAKPGALPGIRALAAGLKHHMAVGRTMQSDLRWA